MLAIQTAVTKASLNRAPSLISTLNVNSAGAAPPSNREVLASRASMTRRRAHSMALAINAPTEFFTSTIPSVAQRVKPIGFDEEPCTLGLKDGYSYAKVDIGNRLGDNDRYEVVRKLGWGLYATTWLVKDDQTETYRALKIVNHYGTLLEAGGSTDPNHPRFHEREILVRVSASDGASGAKYCMKLVESFHIRRDTGEHLCLVMELGGMSLQEMRFLIGEDHSMPTAFVKTIIKQMCLALDYLHTECKVVHTDIKPSNILVTFNEKDTRELVDIALKNTPVQRYPPRKVLGDNIEAIRSQPLPLPGLNQCSSPIWTFKLTDFGSAQWVGRRSAYTVQPIRLRAPEVVLGHDWNEKIDVWSIGCLTFEFLTGRTLFRAQGGSNWKAEDDLLANQLELLSLKQFPSYFNQNSRYALYHLKEDGSLKNIPETMMYPKTLSDALSRHSEAPINLDDTNRERDLALAFIARCLTLDPHQRPSAAQLLRHPWLREFGYHIALANYASPDPTLGRASHRELKATETSAMVTLEDDKALVEDAAKTKFHSTLSLGHPGQTTKVQSTSTGVGSAAVHVLFVLQPLFTL